MTIEAFSPRPREASVTEPLEPAYERVKQMLFQPFDFVRWIILGFCAWLAGLGESGAGGLGGFNANANQNHTNEPVEQFRHFYHQASDYVVVNLFWIVPLAIVMVGLALAIWAVILWVSSRGKFMFLHCVVHNRAEIDVPWSEYAREANSLFRFRVVMSLLGLVLMLPPAILLATSIIRMVLRGEPDFGGIMLSVALALGLLLLLIICKLIRKFTVDMVVPIMFLRRQTCVAAWREFWGLIASHPGQFALYILFQIVITLAIGFLVLAAMLVTCCIACCLLLLPFVGTLLLLPVRVFQRSYPLYYLGQYGTQYDVFYQAPPPTPPGPELPPINVAA